MRIKLRQIGLNFIVVDQGVTKTITVTKGYNTEKLWSLAQKLNQGSEAALNMFYKEINKFEKPTVVNKELQENRIARKKVKKEIKEIQSFDYNRLPIFVPDEWKAIIDSKENSEHIENFLMWLSLCDNEYTRNNFLKYFDTKYCYITPKGFIASLRQVYKQESNDELYDFIHSKYKQVRATWKKSPKNYYVAKRTSDDGITMYSLHKSEDNFSINHKLVGNLDDLYNNYKSDTKTTYISKYCKDHPHIHQEVWSVGDVVTMPDKATHGQICGVRQYHILQDPLDVLTGVHGTYGDTIILVLVNPSRLIHIEEGWKYTTDQFYFASVLDEEDVEKQFTEQWGLYDFDYLDDSVEEIKRELVSKKEEEVKSANKSKIKTLKESLILGNKTDHIEPVLYSEILQNRINLIN